jgi:predicted DNA-binding transcriptional regulator YafY
MTPELQQQLSTAPSAQIERLAYLEARLYFLGVLQRNDLMQRFAVATVQASRDVALYRQLAADNLYYDASAKRYFPSDNFKRLFSFPVRDVLLWLTSGRGDGLKHASGLAVDAVPAPGLPAAPQLATITRAIYRGKALSLNYLSLTHGAQRREIVPHALADSGLRWHVRAFDRQNQRFADFVINRMSELSVLDGAIASEQTAKYDGQWQEMVTLELIPHPRLAQQAAILADYAMEDGHLCLSSRQALAGYLLRRWNVDATQDHSLNDGAIQLALANPQVLEGIESAVLAPGRSA